MKNVTIKDVARISNVSRTTVSRVINKSSLVKESTMKAVYEAMEKSGYVYNAVAGNLSRRKTSIIGLIIPTIKNSIFSLSTLGIQEYAHERGYTVLLGNSNYSKQDENHLLFLFMERRVDGLILTGRGQDPSLIKNLQKKTIPFVITWQTFQSDEDLNFVGFDNFAAAYKMVEYLIGLQHRRIGLIVGRFSKTERALERWKGYEDCLSNHGIEYDPQLIIEKDYSFIEGKEGMQRLLSLHPPPTAVFCASDILAVGAMSSIREKGLSIPGDISIGGFDDNEYASFCVPALTTIRVPTYEMGKLAAQVLIDIVEGQRTYTSHYCLETDLIIRGSCKALDS